MRRLRLVWIALGVTSLAGVVALFLLPTSWQVERQVTIAAPAEAIWPWLIDLERWPSWSPWREEDYPGLEFRYSSPAAGPGAELTWDSEATGDGSLRLEAAEPPRRLTVAMAYQQGRITSRDTLELAPLPGGGTRVTWSERGSLGHTLLGRLSVPVIEESMGRDLERGLEGLRRVVEGEAPGEL